MESTQAADALATVVENAVDNQITAASLDKGRAPRLLVDPSHSSANLDPQLDVASWRSLIDPHRNAPPTVIDESECRPHWRF